MPHLRFHKDKIDSPHQAERCRSVVPVQLFVLKDEVGNDGKYHQGDALLDHLQLHQVEWSTVIHKADTVGRHLTAVLEKGNHPRESNHQIKGPVS